MERTNHYRVTYATGPDGRRVPRVWRGVLVRHEDGSLWTHYVHEEAAA